MFYGNYTHIDEIIEKIYNRYRLPNIDRDIALETAWLGLANLGVAEFLEDFSSEVTIEDYRGLLPNNIMILKGIKDKATGKVLIPSTNIFFSEDMQESGIRGQTYIAGYTTTENVEILPIGNGQYNIETTVVEQRAFVEGMGAGQLPSSFEYQIKNNIIKCNVRNAVLLVEYKGFPLWDDGTPKIPDDSKVIDYMVNYIAKEIATGMFMVDKLSAHKYELISQNAYYSQGAARNKMLTPDMATMEAFRQMIQRLVPHPTRFLDGFRNLYK